MMMMMIKPLLVVVRPRLSLTTTLLVWLFFSTKTTATTAAFEEEPPAFTTTLSFDHESSSPFEEAGIVQAETMITGGSSKGRPPALEVVWDETKWESVSNLQDIYNQLGSQRGKKGYVIPQEEVEFFESTGNVPRYGEIPYESAQILLEYFQPTSVDKFYDLGSGVGKLVLHAYLTTNVSKSCGIELSPSRHQLAKAAVQIGQELGYLDQQQKEGGQQQHEKKHELILLNQDFLTVNLTDATLVYIASTAYPKEVMDQIACKLLLSTSPSMIQQQQHDSDYDESTNSSASGRRSHVRRIATLKRFDEKYTTTTHSSRLELIDSIQLPMTWSARGGQGSTVYIYDQVVQVVG